jgi:NADPH:quinone reductase-like Zn-dependent oxidoreductase
MKAVRFSEYGNPEVLEVVETEEPHAGPGEVRIAVHAAGVNGLDWKIRSGALREMRPLDLPAGTGIDASGVVDEIGEGVSDIEIGDAVFGTGSETVAEYAVLTSWALKPDGLAFEEAAGFPIPAETAIRIIEQVGVEPGQTLLVSGASGGVGSAVLQIARERGINVIGTASSTNQDYLRSLGAVATTYGDGLVDRVRELAPDGVDAALDLAGSGVIEELIELTGEPSKVLSISDFGAGRFGAQISNAPVDPPKAFAGAARLSAEGSFTIPVARTFTMNEAGEAHAASQAGHVTGGFVIVID